MEGEQRNDDKPQGGIAEFKWQVTWKHRFAMHSKAPVIESRAQEEKERRAKSDCFVLAQEFSLNCRKNGSNDRHHAKNRKVRRSKHMEADRHA